MFIRVNLGGGSETITLYAWADDGNFNLYRESVYRFQHTHLAKAMSANYFPISRNDDSYVTFRSKKNITEWAKAVEDSEFNDPQRYRIREHNCSIAAVAVLRLAEIDLLPNRDYMIFNRIPLPIGECRAPLCTLTPNDVYELAKASKLKDLKNSHGEVRYRFAGNGLKWWIDHTPLLQEKSLVTTIVDEIDKRHQKHPEHTEEQIEVLVQTYQLVKHLPSPEEYDDYLRSADRFKQRKATDEAILIDKIILLQFISLILLMGVGLDFGRYSYSGKSVLGLLQGMALLGTSLFTFFTGCRKIAPISDAPGYTIEPTNLSDTMTTLAHLRQRNIP